MTCDFGIIDKFDKNAKKNLTSSADCGIIIVKSLSTVLSA